MTQETLFPLGPSSSSAKVHIQKGDEKQLCELLVGRNICGWVPEDEILRVGGVKVLNGLFGVGKGKFLDENNEIEILRVIMNLKPTNRIMKMLRVRLGSCLLLLSICLWSWKGRKKQFYFNLI